MSLRVSHFSYDTIFSHNFVFLSFHTAANHLSACTLLTPPPPTQLCIHICEAYPNIQTQPLPPITISLIKDKLGGHVTCQLIAYTLTPNSNLHFCDPECVIWYIIIYLWKIISWFITPDCDHLGKAHTRIKCWQFRQTMDVIKLVSVICIISTFRQYKSYDVHIYMYMSW